MPWEVLAAMDDLVFNQRKAAYSDTSAGRFKVPWLSLVQTTDIGLVQDTLKGFAAKGYVPTGAVTINGKALVSPGEAKARYQAALQWVDAHGLLIISNGPFFLARFDPAAQFAEIDAFRDPTYPFKAGSHYLGEAPRVEIKQVQQPKVSLGKPADISVEINGKGTLGLHWVLVDTSTAAIVQSGDAQKGADNRFHVKLDGTSTAKLKAGLYRLSLAAYSDAIVTLAQRDVDVPISA